MHRDMHSLASAVGFIPTNGDLKNTGMYFLIKV